MCFWRKPHFKARCRRANLTWSVCRVCRAFLFEVAGQLELSDFYHFCLFYFSAVMYTSILPAAAEVVQVSLNRREKERENTAECYTWLLLARVDIPARANVRQFIFNRNWIRALPWSCLLGLLILSRANTHLGMSCWAASQSRKWKSHVWTPVCGSWEASGAEQAQALQEASSHSRPLALIRVLMVQPRSAAYLPTQIVVYFDVHCVRLLLCCRLVIIQINVTD